MDIYEAAIFKQRQKNIADVKRKLEQGDKDLLIKVENFSQNFSFPKDQIIEAIRTNPIIAAVFAVEPTRQNIFENIAADYIEKLPGVTNFAHYSNKALYVSRGEVIDRAALQEYPHAKTIDFGWDFGIFGIYAAHKYTKQGGGAQDKQYIDLQNFIYECRDSKRTNVRFIAIADGAYYQRNDSQADKKRIDNLRALCTQIVVACTIFELPKVLVALQ